MSIKVLGYTGGEVGEIPSVLEYHCISEISGIWDFKNGRIIVALDEGANSTEKSNGPSGTHYSMRVLNASYSSNFGLDIDLTYDDKIPGTVDFVISRRGNELVATLPHSIACYIPGVVGIDRAKVTLSWIESSMLSGEKILRNIENYTEKEMTGFVSFRGIRKSLKKTAIAAGLNEWDFIESFFSGISETESLSVAVVKRPAVNSFGGKSFNFFVALCHQDAVEKFEESDEFFNSEIKMAWDRGPFFTLIIDCPPYKPYFCKSQ